MEDWELEWRQKRAEQTAVRANQRAAELEKRAAFPEKQDVIITKLENFVLKWNSNDAKGSVSKQIRSERIRPDLYRVATITTRTVALADGATSDTHLELDVEFDDLNAVVKSSLHPPWSDDFLGEQVVLSLVVTASGGRYFSGSDRKMIENGHIVGEIIRPLLQYL
jgi:hypothetical protein